MKTLNSELYTTEELQFYKTLYGHIKPNFYFPACVKHIPHWFTLKAGSVKSQCMYQNASMADQFCPKL